jgi:hypothetical protein
VHANIVLNVNSLVVDPNVAPTVREPGKHLLSLEVHFDFQMQEA